jgi:uncharacterized coiled-coil protein SlyX
VKMSLSRHFAQSKNEFRKKDWPHLKTMFSDRSDDRKNREAFLATCDTVTRTSLHLSQYLDLHKDFDTSTRLLLWIDKLHLFQLFLIDQLHAYLRAAQPRDLSADDKNKAEATHTAIDTASTSLMTGVMQVSRDVAFHLKDSDGAQADRLISMDRDLRQLNDILSRHAKDVERISQQVQKLEGQAEARSRDVGLLDEVILQTREHLRQIHDLATVKTQEVARLEETANHLTQTLSSWQHEVNSRLDDLTQNGSRDVDIVTSSVTRLADRLNRETDELHAKLDRVTAKVEEVSKSEDLNEKVSQLESEVGLLRRRLDECLDRTVRSRSPSYREQSERSPPRRIPRSARMGRSAWPLRRATEGIQIRSREIPYVKVTVPYGTMTPKVPVTQEGGKDVGDGGDVGSWGNNTNSSWTEEPVDVKPKFTDTSSPFDTWGLQPTLVKSEFTELPEPTGEKKSEFHDLPELIPPDNLTIKNRQVLRRPICNESWDEILNETQQQKVTPVVVSPRREFTYFTAPGPNEPPATREVRQNPETQETQEVPKNPESTSYFYSEPAGYHQIGTSWVPGKIPRQTSSDLVQTSPQNSAGPFDESSELSSETSIESKEFTPSTEPAGVSQSSESHYTEVIRMQPVKSVVIEP